MIEAQNRHLILVHSCCWSFSSSQTSRFRPMSLPDWICYSMLRIPSVQSFST